MRVPSLLALAAAGALLLPVAANAGNFPAGKEAAYTAQCTQVAGSQGVDAATAKTLRLRRTSDQKEFYRRRDCRPDSKDGVDAKLMQKAQTVVQQACAPKR